MKRYFSLFIFLIPSAYFALPALSLGQTNNDGSMQHDMEGMQGRMGKEQSQPPVSSQNPAQQTGPEMPAPDLLKEAMKRKALNLPDFEATAASSNPTLRQADDLSRSSAGRAKQAGLYPNPSVGYEGDQIRGGSYGGGEQGAFVQQTIVLGGKLGLRRRVYQEQHREDELRAAEQRERVTSEVAQLFYATLAAQETVGVRRNLLKLSLDAVQTAHQLANVGQADAPDVLQSEVEAEQAQMDYITAQRMFIQQFRHLAVLAGNPQLPLTKVDGNLEQTPAIDPDHVMDLMLQNSPEVKRAQQAVSVAEAQLKSARREAVPDLTLRAGLQQNYEPINPAGRPVGLQGFGIGSVTLPIFNRNQGNVQAAKAELERAQSEIGRVRLSLRQTAEPMVQSYLADQAQAERYKNEMIPRASRAYHLYLNRYQAMAAAYPEVIVSQRTLFQLQISYIRTLQNLWMNVVALQHFTLTDGLGAPTPAGSPGSNVNLPNAGGGSGD